MEKQIPVSIVVLSYNHENFIERCLYSATNQTFTDFEIIYLDNNSLDRTYERGLKILQDSGVKFYAEKTETNLGISKGFNYALKNANGYFISTLAGDDWWDVENLKVKMEYAGEHTEYGMIYGNGYTYDDESQEIGLFYKKPSVNGSIFRELLKAPNINPQGILYNNTLIKSLGFFDENGKVEDRDLWLRIALVSKIGYVHRALTFYRVNHGNNISSNIEYMRSGNEYFFQKYEKEYPNEVREARIKQYQFFAYTLAEKKPGWESLRFMMKNYQFDYIYNKQILKCIINMLNK